MERKPMKVSYSILSAWARGDFDRAVAPFVGGHVDPNEAMIDGKKYHEKWERETLRTKRAPKIFGGEKLRNYSIEMQTKRTVQLNDWLWLSGVLDRKDQPEWLTTGMRGVDYKRSTANATSWNNTKQGAIYQILYPELTRFEFHVFNPFLPKNDPDRVTVSIVHLTPKTLEEGIEWILTNASELYNYLVENKLDYNLMREAR